MSRNIFERKKLSVIDGTKYGIQEAFSWVLNYYNPYKNTPEVMPKVLDSTCSEMFMWHKNDLNKFKVIRNDLDPSIDADYHKDVRFLHHFIKGIFDIIIYDPPYVDLKNRKDTKEKEKLYGYNKMKGLRELILTTLFASDAFYNLLDKNGVLIAKITNFHWKNRLRGSYEIINYLRDNFYLWDEVIYRFYKFIPNLGLYGKKVAKTHTYFLIFKKRKKRGDGLKDMNTMKLIESINKVYKQLEVDYGKS